MGSGYLTRFAAKMHEAQAGFGVRRLVAAFRCIMSFLKARSSQLSKQRQVAALQIVFNRLLALPQKLAGTINAAARAGSADALVRTFCVAQPR